MTKIAENSLDLLSGQIFRFIKRAMSIQSILSDFYWRQPECRSHLPIFGDNAFHVACEKGYIDMVKILCSDPRIDPKRVDSKGLRLACLTGRLGSGQVSA